MSRLVHVIGAGLSGLAAAVQLQRRGARVVLHEAAPHAGGRCRSYFDGKLNATVDIGNHLVLSGNHAMLGFARAIGAADDLLGPTRPDYPFVDLKNDARWTVRLSSGRLPKWVFDPASRVPGTQPADYLSLASLLWAKPGRTIAQSLRAHGRVWDALLRPLLLSALNTDPAEASALVAGNLLRETLVAGGQACRPLVAGSGLGHAFVDPALRHLQYGGADIRLGARLSGIGFNGADSKQRVSALDFADGPIAVAPSDGVVLAVPPDVARMLVPGLTAPTEYRAIVTAHFAVDPPFGFAPATCLLNGTANWLFAFDGRLSVTVCDAGRFLDTPHDELARTLWAETAKAAGMAAAPMPPWQIAAEPRATLAALPAQEGLRPATRTRWPNLMLAGDWTATGLPATIEGAIRSGQKAADALMNPSMDR
ncbi:hydroxysqualene dehydroxylase HpnE [Caballeronia telluris]|uniref:Amine oxidase n=1 Tax=Caballeronia telluris TaxID=326475 RepID=A0A158EPZ7_9BURK|nr:hydroxysqualene dehydroxylase HpnE [Caballeronia telluris]SAL09159.1 amine oxidase [Caballeronia telluris]